MASLDYLIFLAVCFLGCVCIVIVVLIVFLLVPSKPKKKPIT